MFQVSAEVAHRSIPQGLFSDNTLPGASKRRSDKQRHQHNAVRYETVNYAQLLKNVREKLIE
jgi:hypothetical protein